MGPFGLPFEGPSEMASMALVPEPSRAAPVNGEPSGGESERAADPTTSRSSRPAASRG
jgi:hypothetical protein